MRFGRESLEPLAVKNGDAIVGIEDQFAGLFDLFDLADAVIGKAIFGGEVGKRFAVIPVSAIAIAAKPHVAIVFVQKSKDGCMEFFGGLANFFRRHFGGNAPRRGAIAGAERDREGKEQERRELHSALDNTFRITIRSRLIPYSGIWNPEYGTMR